MTRKRKLNPNPSGEDYSKIPRLIIGYYLQGESQDRSTIYGRISSDFAYEVDPPFTLKEMAKIMFAAKQEAFKILQRRKTAEKN